jgi:NADP-reducing hydrogenase subunit HndB
MNRMKWNATMKKIQSLEDLARFRQQVMEERQRHASPDRVELIVSLGSCGIAAGALDVLHAVQDEIKTHDLHDITVLQTGCIGLCSHEPILEVRIGDETKATYGKVAPDVVKRIIQEHILEGKVVEEFVVDTTPFPTI